MPGIALLCLNPNLSNSGGQIGALAVRFSGWQEILKLEFSQPNSLERCRYRNLLADNDGENAKYLSPQEKVLNTLVFYAIAFHLFFFVVYF
ncbi:MAG: hypothetical protein JXD19_12730 [Deltaproteobacteria bacterium]|nr:hypothetical protein [Deltaproteobacteria bacterium]